MKGKNSANSSEVIVNSPSPNTTMESSDSSSLTQINIKILDKLFLPKGKSKLELYECWKCHNDQNAKFETDEKKRSEQTSKIVEELDYIHENINQNIFDLMKDASKIMKHFKSDLAEYQEIQDYYSKNKTLLTYIEENFFNIEENPTQILEDKKKTAINEWISYLTKEIIPYQSKLQKELKSQFKLIDDKCYDCRTKLSNLQELQEKLLKENINVNKENEHLLLNSKRTKSETLLKELEYAIYVTSLQNIIFDFSKLLNELLILYERQITAIYSNVKKNMLDFFLKKSQIIGITPTEKECQSKLLMTSETIEIKLKLSPEPEFAKFSEMTIKQISDFIEKVVIQFFPLPKINSELLNGTLQIVNWVFGKKFTTSFIRLSIDGMLFFFQNELEVKPHFSIDIYQSIINFSTNLNEEIEIIEEQNSYIFLFIPSNKKISIKFKKDLIPFFDIIKSMCKKQN